MSGGKFRHLREISSPFQVSGFGRFATVPWFLRALGTVYLAAFVSFGIQATGLIGSQGILPAAEYFRALRQTLGPAAYWDAPGLLWLGSGDGAILSVWLVGAAAALTATAGWWQRSSLTVCLIMWLSLCSAGQDFLPFQWDLLLVEAGFLAIFADNGAVTVYLFRWLLFRLMFFSGLAKLLSHDPVWHDLTTLDYHYWTQPLPNPVAWLMSQLPMGWQKASTAVVFAVELLVPVLFFAPRGLRRIAAAATIGLQVLILLTGNYAFFNFLTIALALWLFIDPQGSCRSPLRIGLAIFIGTVSGLVSLEQLSLPLPPGGGELLHVVTPLRLVNPYGLFASMTTSRPEIIVEGSRDGVAWQAYEFRYKPGNPDRMPPIVAPHQPRLDWQMWFAALGTYQNNQWFVRFMERLLQGEPAVLRLLQSNPFGNTPPKYVRARIFEYRFTRWGERGWWRRHETGVYFPPVSLR